MDGSHRKARREMAAATPRTVYRAQQLRRRPAPVIVGSLTLPGRTRNVAEAGRSSPRRSAPSTRAATPPFYCALSWSPTRSLHSASGLPGGTVTVVVLRLTGAVRVEVIDHGSTASTPVVKGEVLAPDGHGLFLVDQLADSWGYVLDQVGTTVWFRLTG